MLWSCGIWLSLDGVSSLSLGLRGVLFIGSDVSAPDNGSVDIAFPAWRRKQKLRSRPV
jgi:hypothetical protein